MNVKPILDRVLVKVDEENALQANSSIIVSYARDIPPSRTGVIVSVGPGKRNDKGELIPVKLEVGQRCLFTYIGGLEISEGYRLYAESEVLGIIEDGN